MALFLGGVGALLAAVVVWAWAQGRRQRSELREALAASPYDYQAQAQGEGYLVWDKRTGSTVFAARSEAEALGFIRRMSQLEVTE